MALTSRIAVATMAAAPEVMCGMPAFAAFDVLAAGAPTGSVYAACCVANGGNEYCHCAEVPSCAYQPIAADTGAKLACKGGASDSTYFATAP